MSRICLSLHNRRSTASRKSFRSLSAYVKDPEALAQCQALEQNVTEFGLRYFGVTDRRQG